MEDKYLKNAEKEDNNMENKNNTQEMKRAYAKYLIKRMSTSNCK